MDFSYQEEEQAVAELARKILEDQSTNERKKELEASSAAYDEGLWKGFGVELLEGDCDWPAVMKALDEIGFSGWATAEIAGGGRERLQDISERMDRILVS